MEQSHIYPTVNPAEMYTMVNYKNKFTFANALYHKLLVCAAGEVANLAHSQCIGNSKIYHKSLYGKIQ